jgi:glycosyltransferase involved in cell wall biosynthesis
MRTGARLRTKTAVDHGCLRLFDAVITSCPRESERMARRPGLPPVRFVANGVRVPERTDRRVMRDRLGLAPDRRVVGFVGRLAPEKLPDLFVDMAARLVPDHADVHFALFGGGPDLAATSRRVDRRDLGDRIHVAGYWPDPATILSGLDLLVCPLRRRGPGPGRAAVHAGADAGRGRRRLRRDRGPGPRPTPGERRLLTAPHGRLAPVSRVVDDGDVTCAPRRST